MQAVKVRVLSWAPYLIDIIRVSPPSSAPGLGCGRGFRGLRPLSVACGSARRSACMASRATRRTVALQFSPAARSRSSMAKVGRSSQSLTPPCGRSLVARPAHRARRRWPHRPRQLSGSRSWPQDRAVHSGIRVRGGWGCSSIRSWTSRS